MRDTGRKRAVSPKEERGERKKRVERNRGVRISAYMYRQTNVQWTYTSYRVAMPQKNTEKTTKIVYIRIFT